MKPSIEKAMNRLIRISLVNTIYVMMKGYACGSGII